MPAHLTLLNRKLVEVAAGTIPRLLVCMPPRHGKSLLCSQFFPAWYLGTYPDRRVLLTSYQADFAAQWGRRSRDLLLEYGRSVFAVEVAPGVAAAERWELARWGGGMQTAGVGGAITGKGAHLLVIDDPVKNAEEAMSSTLRSKTWEWYLSTAYTRLEPGGAVVLVQTRWHAADLAGRVLGEASAEEPWETIHLPALAEADDTLGRAPGTALWPERYSAARLANIRRTLGSFWFAALYQQRPTPAEGGLFRRSWFRYWQPVEDLFHLSAGAVRAADCWRFATVDLAISQEQTADFTVIAVWAVTPGGDLILLELLRERLPAPALLPTLHALTQRWQLDYFAVEKVGFQEALIQQARRAGLAVRGVAAHGDKVSRAAAASIRFEAGLVHFPRGARFLNDLEDELLQFPHAPHDDQVDAIAYACLEVGRRYGIGNVHPLTSNHSRDITPVE